MQSGSGLRVTFQVIDGVDKGKVYRDLPIPLTIGREEGNLLRLSDERVSRFHAKIQQDGNDFILTDLESTNGTKVNGHLIQIRRLRYGDRLTIGRTLLLFGSDEEICERRAAERALARTQEGIASHGATHEQLPATVRGSFARPPEPNECEFSLNIQQDVTVAEGNLYVGANQLPPLPLKLSPSQAARLAEILHFLHFRLSQAVEHIRSNEDGNHVSLLFDDWQEVLAVQKLLARYHRAVTEPDVLQQ